MKSSLRSDAKRRLARITGQVAGVQRMIEGERNCGEILQQVMAVKAALDQLGILLLTEHLQTCVLHQNVDDEHDCCTDLPQDLRSAEIKSTLTRFLK